MKLARSILLVSLAAAASACAQTERDVYGYQTGELVLRAEAIVEDAQPSPARDAVVDTLERYNLAVAGGDAAAMRLALDDLNRAVSAWGAR